MLLNGINSDDYIYFRLLEESEFYPYGFSNLRKDTVLRFKIDALRDNLWRRKVFENLDCFEFIPNKEASPYDYLPSRLYQGVVVKKDINLEINMDARDILLIDEWLWQKLNSSEVPALTPNNALSFMFGCTRSKSPVERNRYNLQHTRIIRYDGEEYVGSDIFEPNRKFKDTLALPPFVSSSNLIIDSSQNEKISDAYQFGNSEFIVVPFKKGEVLSFNRAVINFLFLRQDWIRLLLALNQVSEEEHLRYFEIDFAGYIPEANRRYFKIYDYLKLHSLQDITQNDIFQSIMARDSSFQNLFYSDHWRYSSADNFDFDDDGYLRYVWCADEPLVEHELSKIAERVSYSEGMEHYKHEMDTIEHLKRQRELERTALEYFKNNKGRFYKLKRTNPNITYIEFMNIEEDRTKKVLVKRLVNALNSQIIKSKDTYN